MSSAPLVSIVLPTYNRRAALPAAIEGALDQTTPQDAYELIVVDNNSTDGTSEILETFARRYPTRVRPILERRQGVSYARNSGIEAASGQIIALFDDDVCVPRNWIATILRLFGERDDVDCVGGRVLPVWSAPAPRWLSRDHWAPLALQDFGDAPFLATTANPRALISANLACRKAVFTRIGGFSPQFQRVKDGIGSLEDNEWIRRLWKAGGRGLYAPELVVTTQVPAARLTRSYHRRWHQGHGRFYASLRAEEIERTSMGTLFGVPAHLYRSALGSVGPWIASIVAGRTDAAFLYETRIRFFWGFFRQRLRDHAQAVANPVGSVRGT